MMADSATYRNDIFIGSKLSWHRNGTLSDSVTHINDSLDIHFGWFEDGAPSFAGYLLRGKLHGRWQYFHRNGKVASIESYNRGIETGKQCFNEDSSPSSDSANVTREASFTKGGIAGWRKYLEKNLNWPPGYKFSNGTQATIGVNFVVNEYGKIEDVEISIPFHPVLDEIAVNAIKKSPPWLPAISHNRKVKSWHTQPVTFAEAE